MKKLGAVLPIILLIIAGTATAQPALEKFNLDKDLTYVGFRVNYLLIFPVTGRFNDFEGSFVIDRDHSENNHADIIIKTASVDIGTESKNRDIQGPALFDVGKYPEMIFHSNNIELGPHNTGRITGNLTLRGTTKPIVLNLIRNPNAVLRETGTKRSHTDGFMVTGKIKRSDFGMNNFAMPIGDTITLFLCYRLEKCNEAQKPEKNKPRYNQ